MGKGHNIFNTMPQATEQEQACEIIWNVYKFFKEHKPEGDILVTVTEATGISRRTAARIIGEGRSIDEGTSSSFATPKPGLKKSSPKSSIDNCGEEAIRRTIHNFHITHKKRPTLGAAYNGTRDDVDGKKTTDNRKLLLEKTDIRQLRYKYIRQISKYRAEGRPILYTDETQQQYPYYPI
ncbi:hypothetical protein QE152_g30080 [Popillia japonica]|uniref:Uncharacterized protein n=1 Tax=Popillia japonica TaxID=7064 RepID=A0AAW1JFU0_POPJA